MAGVSKTPKPIDQTTLLEFSRMGRLAFYGLILILAVFYELQYQTFVNFGLLFPVYAVLGAGFLSDVLLMKFANYDERKIRRGLKMALPFDAALLTCLLFLTQVPNSLFLFFYLFLIFLAGLVFRTRGALFQGLISSVLFSLFLATQIQLETQSRVLLFGVNNFGFLAVAILSGYLSEQLYGLNAEIQVQKRTLKTLKNLNELVVNQMQSGLMTVTPGFEIVQLNPAGMTILGARPERLRGMGDLGRELQFVLENFQPQPERARSNIEIQYTAAGIRKTLDVSISKLFMNEAELSAYILIFQDVSERRRLEEKLKQREKLAAIGQLAAGIAHEIRNPLASMSGSIQMLKSHLKNLDDDQLKLMNIAVKETDRLNNLISEFLEFVRPESGLQAIVDLEKILREILDVVKINKDLRQNVQQQIFLETNLTIQGNGDKLRQVFLNMMINAYHALEKVNDPSLTVHGRTDGENIEIEIADNGSGMKPDVQARIFEPFFTTKPKGTGLGLAIAHKILEAHHADIRIDSKKDEGTKFIIRFPKWTQSAANDNQKKQHARGG